MNVSYEGAVHGSVWVVTVAEMQIDEDSVFADWYQAVEPRVRAALVAHLGPDAGREAAAAALSWAWEHWERMATIDNQVAYLYRVGRSKARRRRQGWMPAVEMDGEARFEPGLPAAMAHLPAKQRAAVVLVHGYGWSFAETADLLGVSKSTVQTHVERGMTALRERLGVDQ